MSSVRCVVNLQKSNMSDYNPLSKHKETFVCLSISDICCMFASKKYETLSHQFFLSPFPPLWPTHLPPSPPSRRAVNAEKLFNLPVTSYPDLLFIEQQLEKLERIFACYREQQDTVRLYGQFAPSFCNIHTRVKHLGICILILMCPSSPCPVRSNCGCTGSFVGRDALGRSAH